MIEDQNPANQQGASDGAPNSSSLPDQPPAKRNEHTPKPDHEVWREWVRFGLEVVALIYLARYVHWTKVQSIATEQAAVAAKDGADAAIASAKSAKESADAALKSNELTARSLIIDESPYIFATKMTFKPFRVGDKITARLTFENKGKREARQFVLFGKILVTASLPSAVPFGGPENPTELIPSTPDQESIVADTPLTKNEMNDIHAGRKTVYVVGAFKYRNPIVSFRQPHEIAAYCGQYSAKAGGAIGCPFVPIAGISDSDASTH